MERLRLGILVIFLAAFVSSGASLGWDLDVLEEPQSFTGVSENHTTVQLINITNSDGEPVNEKDAEDNVHVEFNLSETGEFDDADWESMHHAHEGLWYAEFDTSNDVEIMYRVREQGVSPDQINETEMITVGDWEIDILQGEREKYKVGNEPVFEANLTDQDGNIISGKDVNVTYAAIEQPSRTGLGYSESSETYSNLAEVPEFYGQTIAVHINAFDSDTNEYGSTSFIAETFPEDLGHIEYLNSTSGCSSDSFPEECEPHANVSTGYNVTELSASRADLQLWAEDHSEGMEIVEEHSMNEEDGLWETEFDFPELNSSVYENEVTLSYNLTIDGELFIENTTVNLEYFQIQDKSNPTAFQGEDYDLRVAVQRPFSLKALNQSQVGGGNITIEDPDGAEFESLNVSDLSFNSQDGVHETIISIPSDAETGTYSTDIEVEDIYGKQQTLSSGFDLEPLSATFNLLDGDIDSVYDIFGDFTKQVEVENTVNRNITLNYSVTGDLSDNITIDEGPEIDLDEGEVRNLTVSVPIQEISDISSEISLMDNETGYERSFDVDLTDPGDCMVSNGSICLASESIDVTADEPEEHYEIIQVRSFSEFGFEDVSISVEGNVSEYVAPESSIREVSGTEDINLTFSPLALGYYSGEVVFSDSNNNEVSHDVTYDINEKMLRPEISLVASLSLGDLDEGSSTTEEIDITNEGNTDITDLQASSGEFDVALQDDLSIDQDETVSGTLEFSSVSSESGTVTVTGTNEGEDAEATIDVTANFLSADSEDLANQIDSTEQRITNLVDQAEDDAVIGELQELRLQLDEAQLLLDTGDISEAEQLHNSVEQSLNSIETEIDGSDSGSTPPPPSNGDGSPPPSNGESSLISVPLIGGVVFFLLIIGFVVASSVELEEGDPLYDVLGDR